MFHKITDKKKIQEVLDGFMDSQEEKQPDEFILSIFSREERAGGVAYQGTRPISKTTEEMSGEITYTLANSDSDYTTPIAHLKLSKIEEIQLLS